MSSRRSLALPLCCQAVAACALLFAGAASANNDTDLGRPNRATTALPTPLQQIDDSFDLAREALLALDPEPAAARRHLDRLADLARQLATSGAVLGNNLEKTGAIHRFMHAQVLNGEYRADAHSLAEAMETGRYNCLSSTLLLLTLAAPYDLPLFAVESPGHVVVGVLHDDTITLAETTLPDWQPKPLQATSSAGRLLGPQQLLAVVHYNRAWQLLGEGQFAAATRVNATALRFDPECRPARANLLASLNNWAVALCAAEQYAQALEVLRAGQAIDASFAPFEANRQHVLACAARADNSQKPPNRPGEATAPQAATH